MSALRRALKAVSAALQLGQAAHFAFSSVSASSAYRSGKRGCRRYRSAAQGRVHVPLYRTGVYEGARRRPALLKIRISPLCIYPREAERLSQCRTAMAREVSLLKRELAPAMRRYGASSRVTLAPRRASAALVLPTPLERESAVAVAARVKGRG